MNPVLRNILAVVAGVIAGGAANMAIITASGSVVPLPEGMDPNNMESLKENMHLFEPIHFLMPFLAHALGSFAGALVAAFLAANHKMKFAIGLGILTMIGGIMAATMIPSPTWFIVADLTLAYIPSAFLAGKIAGRS